MMTIGDIEKELNEQYVYPNNVFVIPYIKENSGIGKRTAHSEQNPYAWEKNIISSKIDFYRPIVLCLGGTGIDDDQSANGVAKQVQKLLGLSGVDDDRMKQMQLLSVVYPSDLKRLSSERNKFKRGEARERLDYIEGIYNTVFRPIIFPNGELFKNYEDIKRKFRNITIFSHCHGSFVACELINYLKQDLDRIAKYEGFSDSFCKNIIREITSIMLSPRDGVQRCGGSLNIGFTFASDNLPGVVDEDFRIGYKNVGVSDFATRLKYNKIKGSDSFYYMCGGLHNFWDTNVFGADVEFIENMDGDYFGGVSYMSVVHECFYARETPHFHLFENYCSLFGKYEEQEEEIGIIRKNRRGQNFTKVIAKALQNAVSLSIIGKERNLENIISNDTKIAFEQGEKNKNIHFSDVKFEGSLSDFGNNARKVLPQKQNVDGIKRCINESVIVPTLDMQKIIEEAKAKTI